MKYPFTLSHFAAAVIISVIILLLYASVQQVHRSSANDPQLQIARDLSNAMSLGKSLNNLISHDTIDLTKSLALFTEVFDKNGNPMQSTGILNGELPKLPAGVIQYTNSNMENVLTWQPQNGLRLAMVFEKINAPGEGFVAVGRSLKETEIHEGNLLRMCGIAWAACMAVLLIHLFVQTYVTTKSFW